MASRRQYLTQAELAEFADITITDTTEADDQISMAEELIDAYIGFQRKSIAREYRGEVTSATSTTVIDSGTGTQLDVLADFFVGCEIEIIGGTGSGQRRTISASVQSTKQLTVSSAWTTNPDSTSTFRVYQLGKFPRSGDRYLNRAGTKYYYTIPEALRRAVAAQVEFMIEMGASYFSGINSEKESESIGNYSYSRGQAAQQSSSVKAIAPKARTLLKGIKNSTGRIVAEIGAWPQ